MVRVTAVDFTKLVNFLKKEAMDGAVLSFKVSDLGTKLVISTVDRYGKQMIIELFDTNCAFMPTVTKTETF